MPKESAGILMYKRQGDNVLVLLAHPGGPFWRNRDEGAWTIPKGEPGTNESASEAARREFEEELGISVTAALQPLGRIRQQGGKWVEAFAVEGDFDPAGLHSNTFEIEWPPRSGRMASFPEVDRALWLPLALARRKILPSQEALLDRLEAWLGNSQPGPDTTL